MRDVPVAELIALLFPHLSTIWIQGVTRSGGSIALHAQPTAPTVVCPQCGTESARVHSRYQRTVADLATAGQEVVLRLQVRRFFCGKEGCQRRISAEQVDGLTVRYGRRRVQLRDILQCIGLALGGRPGAPLCCGIASAVSRMTLVRLIRALPQCH